MARELQLYAFSAAIWKKSVGDAGVDLSSSNAPETAKAGGAVVKHVTTGQTPEAGPKADRFLYALGQVVLGPGRSSDIDGVPFANTGPMRAVAQFLGNGRSLSGGALDPHAIYGWIECGAELDALVALVESKAWAAYTAPFRFRASGVSAFNDDRAAVLAWLSQCKALGQDVFFASQAYWLPKSKLKSAVASTKKPGAPRPAAKRPSAAKPPKKRAAKESTK